MAGDTCTREGCERARVARGLCRSHYTIAHRRGFEEPASLRRPVDFICPPEHRHGEKTTCYLHHRCTCDSCFAAASARRAQYLRDRFYGRPTGTLVSARGVQRRLQALHAIGWSFSEIARRLGMTPTNVAIFLERTSVEPATDERFRALFAELEMQLPPAETLAQRRAIAYARRRAADRGWVPPLAWDDIDEDAAPAEVAPSEDVDQVKVERAIAGAPVALNRAERLEAVRILNGAGRPDGAIAETLRVTDRTVVRIRTTAGISAAVGSDRERIVA